MKKIFYFLIVLLMASAGYSQKAEKYYKKGNEKQQRQDYQGAIDYYSKAIKINPKFAEAYCNRGRSKGELHDYYAQFVDCTKAIAINPDYAEAYVYRGIAKIVLHENSASMNFISALEIGKELKNNPSDTIADVKKGTKSVAKTNSIDYNGAIADFDKAININPDYAEAYYNRGLAKIKLEQKDSGCLDLRKAKESGNKKADDAIKKFCH